MGFNSGFKGLSHVRHEINAQVRFICHVYHYRQSHRHKMKIRRNILPPYRGQNQGHTAHSSQKNQNTIFHANQPRLNFTESVSTKFESDGCRTFQTLQARDSFHTRGAENTWHKVPAKRMYISLCVEWVNVVEMETQQCVLCILLSYMSLSMSVNVVEMETQQCVLCVLLSYMSLSIIPKHYGITSKTHSA